MTFVYSSAKTEIKGVHCNPSYFKGCDIRATLVFTDSDEIKKAYEDAEIEVNPISKVEVKKPKQTRKKKED